MKDKILQIFLNSELIIKSEEKLELYISYCQENSTLKGDTEDHHILPKNDNCFPEYKDLKIFNWNKATLIFEHHYIAHSMLCEAVDDNSVYYAWNAMNSINKKDRSIENLIGKEQYRINRENHRQAVIDYNKTRVISEETREKHRQNAIKQMKGKTFFDSTGLMPAILKETKEKVYITSDEYKNNKKLYETQSSGKISAKDWEGNTFQVDRNDIRYVNGEIGGCTASRCILISPEGIEYKTMNIKAKISELNLAPKISSFKNKGIIN